MDSRILTNEAELNFGDAFENLLQDATLGRKTSLDIINKRKVLMAIAE